MGNYITPSDMEQISKVCKALDEIYEQISSANGELNFDSYFDVGPFKVYDSNGDVIGTIGYTDSGGYGLYLPEED